MGEFPSTCNFAVMVVNCESGSDFTAGVTQGSVLGPILFLYYVKVLMRDIVNPSLILLEASEDISQDLEAIGRRIAG